MSHYTALTQSNRASEFYRADVGDGPSIVKAVRKAAHKMGIQQFACLSAKAERRNFATWSRLRVARITDAGTLAAIAGDERLQAAFRKFDQEVLTAKNT